MSTTGTDESSLARVNETDLELPPGPGPTPNPNPNPNPAPNPTPNPCPTDDGDHHANSSDDDSHDHSRHYHHKSGYGHDMCDDDSSDDRSDDDCKDPHDGRDREYVCEIGDPRDRDDKHCIGISDRERQSVKDASKDGVKVVCMSKEACEKIGGKAFKQARASKRDYCKDDKSRGTSHMSDDKLLQLVDKYMRENPDSQ